MDQDDHKEKSEEEKKEEDKKEEEKDDGTNNQRPNVDTFLPPCELETMFAKGILMPKNDLPKIASTLVPPIEMELTALRVKVACLEKNIAAAKIELKCAELQVEAKDKVDRQKTRLVELLDAKVASLEKKNNTLIDMVENLIKEKETRTCRLTDATKNMEMLSSRLANSERMQRELKITNEELKTMLNNIETKGSQIAKLAKEKIIKYKDENTRIQGELNDIKLIRENSADFNQQWDNLNELGRQLQDKLSAAKTDASDTSAQILGSAEDVRKEMLDKTAQMKSETSSVISRFVALNDKLLAEVNQMKQSFSDLQALSGAPTQSDSSDGQLIALKNAISSLHENGTPKST